MDSQKVRVGAAGTKRCSGLAMKSGGVDNLLVVSHWSGPFGNERMGEAG